MEAYRVVAVSDRPERRHETHFVGRDAELELLRSAWDRTARAGVCEIVTVIGEAGVGKSRLIAELIRAGETRVVTGRCVSYGEGITYLPVVEVIKQLGALPEDPEAAAPLRALLGETETVTSSGEIGWAFRKLLEQESPLLVVFDDLQWGEPTFLDLVERLPAHWSGGGLLVVCLARPELEERRPQWQFPLRLRPLDDAQVRELLPPTLSRSLSDGIVKRAGGNPLFVTEMLAMAAQAGDEVVIPATLKALLAARLDQLAASERTVLEGGSVEGEIFHRRAVEALTPPDAEVLPALTSLVRNELIRSTAGWLAHDEAFRFCHLLVRDAAYEALPKSVRADLHERFAEWLGTAAVDVVERDELMGFHLEQAHRYRLELGTADDSVAARAASKLAAAARRATSRSDFDASANFLERALALGVADPSERLALELELGRAYGATRRVADAEELLVRVADDAEARGAAAIASVARVLRMWNRTGSSSVPNAEMIAVADEAIETLTASGDEAGLVPARRLRAFALNARGDAAAADEEHRRSLAQAEAYGDAELLRSAINTYANGLLTTGPTPASDAIALCQELLARARQDRVLTATLKRPLALFYAMVERPDEALALLDEAAAVLDELYLRNMQVYRAGIGYTRELAGDLDGAERELKAACAYFDALGGRKWDSRSAGAGTELARIYCDQRRWDEAETLMERYPERSHSMSAIRPIVRAGIEARLLAHRGRHDDAVAHAAVAIDAADRMADYPNMRAQVWAAAAEVRRAAGDTGGAEAALARALHLYAEKGNVAAAAQLRATVAVRSR